MLPCCHPDIPPTLSRCCSDVASMLPRCCPDASPSQPPLRGWVGIRLGQGCAARRRPRASQRRLLCDRVVVAALAPRPIALPVGSVACVARCCVGRGGCDRGGIAEAGVGGPGGPGREAGSRFGGRVAAAAHEAAPCHGVRQQPEPQHGGARVAAEAGHGRQLLRHRHQRQTARPVRARAQCLPVRHAVPPDARGS